VAAGEQGVATGQLTVHPGAKVRIDTGAPNGMPPGGSSGAQGGGPGGAPGGASGGVPGSQPARPGAASKTGAAGASPSPTSTTEGGKP